MVFATRKRIYANAFGRNGSRMQKRARFTRKRRFTRKSRRTTDYTSLATRGTSVGFRGRKTSRRAYKRHVWNSTVFKDHWRSFLTMTDTADTVTPAALNTGTITFYNMYNFGSPFWTTAGGAVEKDLSLGVPDFADVTLRGGKFEMTIANQSANDIKFKIWRFNTGNNPVLSTADYIPGPLEPTDQAWDPSVVPDFYTQVGKPFLAREVTLEGGNSYTFVTRFKTQKIDQNAYQNTVASRSPFILVLATNVGNATANDYSIRRSYNLSYAGDAIAPAA